ncbi:MAG: DUF368 domain-containing protein [Bacteroidales bacterium]|nr:DUF368 domain-containing protein [Bacteroidales bacterium]
MKRSLLDYATLGLKGMAIGAVEFLPGISGGTIAFVVGIYYELLSTIKGAIPAFKQLFGKKTFKQRITDFWTAFNGNFVVVLILGMIIAIAATVSLVRYVLANYPIPFHAFVFGLIVASVVLVYKKVSKWTPICYVLGVIGIVLAVTLFPISSVGSNVIVPVWYFFIASIIASCAFILPGTSGTFVMVLMGSYYTFVKAIDELNFAYIGAFVLGCLTGLIAFSNFLSWLLKRWHDWTVALLTGVIVGSLRVIWPWKETVSEQTGMFVFDATGIPWPETIYRTVGNARPDSMVVESAIACAVGIGIVLGIEFVAKAVSKKTS